MANSYFEDADVPMAAQLLKMIMKRAWTGKYVNINRPSLKHSINNLSPFTMLDLNEEEVTWINDEQYLIASASLVSVADLRVQLNKLKICIPTEAEDFMLVPKRYGNLMYAIFWTHFHYSKPLRR